jgi:hypothetical protein
MVSALFHDPGRVGSRSSAADMTTLGLSSVAYILSVFLVVTACFSTFQHRIPLAAVQVTGVWLGGMLYASGVRVETTWWDVTEDAFFLVTTLAQLWPGHAGAAEADGSRSRDNEPPVDTTPGDRLRPTGSATHGT